MTHPSGTFSPESVDPRRQLVLDEARRGIDQQARDLDGLRARGGALIALAAAAGTFLAGVIVNQGLPTNCATWLGFILLGGAVGSGVNTIRPYEFTFTLDITQFDLRSVDESANELVRAATLGLRDAANENQETLDRLIRQYILAICLLLAGAVVVSVSIGWR